MKQDFLDFLETFGEAIVDDNLEAWRDRYYRHTLEYIKSELSINYDWSADIDWCESQLGRALSGEEQEYFIKYFTKKILDEFYLD